MFIITPSIQYKLGIALYYLSILYNKLLLKYIENNDILLRHYHIKKYDSIHDIYNLDYIFNINIRTIINTKLNLVYIDIFHNDEKKSELVIINNNKIINNQIVKIILSLQYLDNYNFINQINIYNCGIIEHKNFLVHHFYNFKGMRRYSID